MRDYSSPPSRPLSWPKPAGVIGRCLASLDRAGVRDVIVVDGRSTDGTTAESGRTGVGRARYRGWLARA
jgi:hypothetical protein